MCQFLEIYCISCIPQKLYKYCKFPFKIWMIAVVFKMTNQFDKLLKQSCVSIQNSPNLWTTCCTVVVVMVTGAMECDVLHAAWYGCILSTNFFLTLLRLFVFCCFCWCNYSRLTLYTILLESEERIDIINRLDMPSNLTSSTTNIEKE